MNIKCVKLNYLEFLMFKYFFVINSGDILFFEGLEGCNENEIFFCE